MRLLHRIFHFFETVNRRRGIRRNTNRYLLTQHDAECAAADAGAPRLAGAAGAREDGRECRGASGKLIDGAWMVFAATELGAGRKSGALDALRRADAGLAGGVVVANRDGQSIIASDLPAMMPLFPMDAPAGDVGFLEAGEMAVVTSERVTYLDLDGATISKQLRHVSPEDVLIDKGGYRHFMLKEIYEQSETITNATKTGTSTMRAAVSWLAGL